MQIYSLIYTGNTHHGIIMHIQNYFCKKCNYNSKMKFIPFTDTKSMICDFGQGLKGFVTYLHLDSVCCYEWLLKCTTTQLTSNQNICKIIIMMHNSHQ